MTRILLFVDSRSLAPFYFREALERKGAEVRLWHMPDYPERLTASFDSASGEAKLRASAPELDLPGDWPEVVWCRRPIAPIPPEAVHPDDREFAIGECDVFTTGLLHALAPDAFWVNPQEAALRTENKIVQHRAALAAGLEQPPTLFSNDPAAIRGFLNAHPEVVYKPFRYASWDDGDETRGIYTSAITEDDLPADDLLRAVPGIYQAMVPKSHELRVTVMGRQTFTVCIDSQDTDGGRTDWRQAYEELTPRLIDTPPEVAAACGQLMDRLGLVFGCFDFIVTPEGRYVFLEVNQAGMFLWIEMVNDQVLLLDAFTDFLLQGGDGKDFAWRESKSSVRFAQIREQALERWESSRSLHVAPPDERRFLEGAT